MAFHWEKAALHRTHVALRDPRVLVQQTGHTAEALGWWDNHREKGALGCLLFLPHTHMPLPAVHPASSGPHLDYDRLGSSLQKAIYSLFRCRLGNFFLGFQSQVLLFHFVTLSLLAWPWFPSQFCLARGYGAPLWAVGTASEPKKPLPLTIKAGEHQQRKPQRVC